MRSVYGRKSLIWDGRDTSNRIYLFPVVCIASATPHGSFSF